MKVLLLGSGGREHALAWKIAQSPKLSKLYIAPGNAGTADCGENIDMAADDFSSIESFMLNNEIDMLVVGPEDPLVKGVAEYFKAKPEFSNLMIIGPAKAGAMLEGSKEYAKEFMVRHNIPTAGYMPVTKENLKEGIEFMKSLQPPYVLKADGLAAGKGVLIIDSIEEAQGELEKMLDGKFGEASKKVVIEEHLKGIEMSAFVITDGESYKILPEAKDYKRIGEGDTGLNTGGMGCVSPVPFADKTFLDKVEGLVIRPTVEGLKKDGIDYIGFIFFGLMNDNGDPKVIEYNVRMGDPETEVIMPRLKGDLLKVFEAAAKKELSSAQLEISPESCTTVMLVSGGYPGSYEKGKEITGLDKAKNCIVFHAGTKIKDSKVVTSGGRVISISALGKDFNTALEKSYANTEIIDFEGKNYRRDIGFDL